MSSPPQPQSPPSHSPTTTTIQPPLSNPPPIIQALSYSPLKKPQPIPWSHQETLNLIKAYQEKWYSLKRGQLKASQWEEVAVTIAARCGLDEPSKSGTQCRHKIEKLRKRYRAEKTKLPPNFNFQNHPWIYFSLMDSLERGPLPISAVPPLIKNDHFDQSDDDFDVGFDQMSKFRSGSLNSRGNFDGFLRKLPKSEDLGNGYQKGGDFNGGFLNLRDLKKRKSYYEDEEDDEDDDDVEEREICELSGEIREFAERLMRIEGKKIELMRENEKLRMEMENKKMEMIIVAQHNIVELISRAFSGGSGAASDSNIQKKMKVTSDL